MSFTKEEEAFIEQVANRVGDHLAGRIATDRKRDIDLALSHHSSHCETTLMVRGINSTMKSNRKLLIGVLLGAGVGGLSGGYSLAKLLETIIK